MSVLCAVRLEGDIVYWASYSLQCRNGTVRVAFLSTHRSSRIRRTLSCLTTGVLTREWSKSIARRCQPHSFVSVFGHVPMVGRILGVSLSPLNHPPLEVIPRTRLSFFSRGVEKDKDSRGSRESNRIDRIGSHNRGTRTTFTRDWIRDRHCLDLPPLAFGFVSGLYLSDHRKDLL